MPTIYLPDPIIENATKQYDQIWVASVNISSPIIDGHITGKISATITVVPYSSSTGEADWKYARTFEIDNIQDKIAQGDMVAGMVFEGVTQYVKDNMPNLWEGL